MAAAIERELGHQAELIAGERGAFNVVAEGETIFSKHKSHRFPEHSEIVAALKARMG